MQNSQYVYATKRQYFDVKSQYVDVQSQYSDVRSQYIDVKSQYFDVTRQYFDIQNKYFDTFLASYVAYAVLSAAAGAFFSTVLHFVVCLGFQKHEKT